MVTGVVPFHVNTAGKFISKAEDRLRSSVMGTSSHRSNSREHVIKKRCLYYINGLGDDGKGRTCVRTNRGVGSGVNQGLR